MACAQMLARIGLALPVTGDNSGAVLNRRWPRYAHCSAPSAASRSYPAEARRAVANGCEAMKLETGFGVEEGIDSVLAVRDGIGPDRKPMLDASGALSSRAAICG